MKVQVVSPWYPDPASVFYGNFVAQQVSALQRCGWDVDVEVPQIFPAPVGPVPEVVSESLKALAAEDADAVYLRRDNVRWIPSPVPARSGYIGRVRAFEAGLRRKRTVLPIDADVIHAHLAVPTGAALLDLDDRPLVVTEHQSTLALVLAESAARDAYRAVIDRADRFYVVSEHLRDTIADSLGRAAADRIEVMPNIVDLTELPYLERASNDRSTEAWLYVGGLLAHKGVKLLVEAFVDSCRRLGRSTRLTLVGDGPLDGWIRQRVAAAGLTDSVNLVGAVPHTDLAEHFASADVFVHLSPAETFGISSLEAIGSGLPVVSLRNGGADHTWGVIEESVGRLLPPSASPATVADAVDDLPTRPLDLRAARTFVEQHFASSVVGSKLSTALAGVVAA